MQQGVYPAYITWETYLENNARLKRNYARFLDPAGRSKGAPRGGGALLQGIAVCGECGARLKVNYNPRPWYFCDEKRYRVVAHSCPAHQGRPVEAAVLRAFFDAISPAHVDALEGVISKEKEEREQLDRHWRRVLKRAEYTAQRDQERYEAVDARNRLVAESLESRWETSLAELRRVRDEYEVFKAREDYAHLLPELREQMKDISASLPRLWAEGNIPPVKMKELLRCLVDKVVLKKVTAGKIEARIVWVSGGCWPLSVPTAMQTFSDSPDYKKVVAIVHKLWKRRMSDTEIARHLNSEGFRSPRAATFLAQTVMKVRHAHGWKTHRRTIRHAGYLKVSEFTRKTRSNEGTVYRYIKNGRIPKKYILFDWMYFIKDCEEVRRLFDRRSRKLQGD